MDKTKSYVNPSISPHVKSRQISTICREVLSTYCLACSLTFIIPGAKIYIYSCANCMHSMYEWLVPKQLARMRRENIHAHRSYISTG